MNPLKNQNVIDNIIKPAAVTIKAYFPKAFLILTLICLAYVGFLGAKYYFLRNEHKKLEIHKKLMKKGAMAIAVMYAAFIIIRIVFALIVNYFNIVI